MVAETLVIIPARKGSKGLPGKNVKPLNGKPLILYAVDLARSIFQDAHICVSTDDEDIITMAKENGLDVPFKRPDHLATDTAGTRDVILHAIEFYEKKGLNFNYVLLLQPTSPFRKKSHVLETIDGFTENIDMIVSVKETKANPYFALFEEDEFGLLQKSKKGNFIRRQDCPKVYEYNGAIYLFRKEIIKEKSFAEIPRIKKYVMDDISSMDIDTPTDWMICESILATQTVKEQ